VNGSGATATANHKLMHLSHYGTLSVCPYAQWNYEIDSEQRYEKQKMI
jgi:VCBS repeat-containing protein